MCYNVQLVKYLVFNLVSSRMLLQITLVQIHIDLDAF